jgi:predicted nucleotidyltransferase
MNLPHSNSIPGDEMHRPAAPIQLDFAGHTGRQQAWLASLLPQLQALPGVSAGWLTGSYARGIADAWSNVNLHIAFADNLPETLRSSMPCLLEEVSPVVWLHVTGDDPLVYRGIAKPIEPEANRPGLIHFEISCVSSTRLAAHVRQHGPIRLLFGQLADGQRSIRAVSTFELPQPAEVQHWLETFWVCLAELPGCINRDENLQAAQVLAQAREILVELVVALNGARRPQGRRRLNDLLGPSQREAFEKTFVVKSIGPAAWIGQAVALVVLYRWYAPQLAERDDIALPQALEDTVLAALARDIPDWPVQIMTE